MTLSELLKRPSITDWCIMAFTGVLACIGLYQGCTTKDQVAEMQRAQRAWVEAIIVQKVETLKVSDITDLTFRMHMENVGTTQLPMWS